MRVAEDILKKLRLVTKKNAAELHIPQIKNIDYEYVNKCLDSGFISSIGSFVTELETQIQSFTQNENAIAVVNGTSGLHALMHAHALNEDCEVLLPAISFIATANSIKYCNALPNFVDVDPETLNICPYKLRTYLKKICTIKDGQTINKDTGRRLLGAIAVYVFGRPPKIIELSKVCKEFDLLLFEDAAAALGSTYKGAHIGKYSEAAVVSFNGNKIISAGGGGLILTNNNQLAENLHHITTTAKIAHPFHFKHDMVGFNYRMPNINAALACAQFSRIKEIISLKRELHTNYKKTFLDIDYGKIVDDTNGEKSNNWLINLKLTEKYMDLSEQILKYLNQNGFKCRPVWLPLHMQPSYKNCPRDDLTKTENVWKQFISLPSSEYVLDD